MPRPNSTYVQSFAGLAVDEIRCKIDQRIEQLERDIRELKKTRNDLAPISKLPTEVLTRIFEHARRWDSDYLHDFQWKDFILVTHVSHAWRAAALACPSLWSHVILGNKNIAREMLERSKAHPILVNIRKLPSWLKTPTGLDLLSSLLQMSRMRKLHIELERGWKIDTVSDIETVSERITGKCATEMRSLYISSDFCPPATHLFSKILSIPMPNLLSLALDFCDILRTVSRDALLAMKPSLMSLTSLTLKDVYEPREKCFYTFLSLMPCLQTLKIVSALPGPCMDESGIDRAVGYNDEQGLPVVFFPQLSSCTIEDSLESITNFHSHISYPKDKCAVRLQPSDSEGIEPTISTITTLLDSCGLLRETCPTNSYSVFSLRRIDEEDHSYILRLGSEGLESILNAERKNNCTDDWQPSGSVYILLPELIDDFVISQFIQQMHAECLKTVSFSERFLRIANQEYHSFFLRHSEITHPVVSYPGEKVISTLAISTNHGQLLYLPHLETLSVELDKRDDSIISTLNGWFEMLANCLSIRYDSGLPVKRLVLLSRCRQRAVNDAMMIRLKKVVDSVEFVGRYSKREMRWITG